MDDIPYIIVDNRKIPPVGRPSRSPRATGERTQQAEDAFGIVDRVTLSKEGRQRSLEQRRGDDAPTAALEGRARPALLTYAPKTLR